jgi:hypothetical protein
VARSARFRRDDLSYVSSYASHLDAPPAHPEDAELHALWRLLEMNKHTEFGMFCRGGADFNHASPYSYRFFSEICWLTDSPRFHVCPVLRITVPLAWPLDDFERRVREIAARLRMRWGCAGLTYSGYAIDWWDEVHQGIHAHSRRYAGYDPAFYVSFMRRWYKQLRTVSWLTFVGPAFAQQIEARGRWFEAGDLVAIERLGDSVLLKAGPAPAEQDINRLQMSPAYQRADEIVRPVRATADVHFLHPWTMASTEQWLRRFEKRIS